MQTFRECERTLPHTFADNWTCNNPLIYADYVCGIGPSTSQNQMKPGAARFLTFGGGHLQIRYNAAVYSHADMPCPFSVKVVSALLVLPLLEDDVTPAYLPNLAISRSQLSVVPATQSDTDENILWIEDTQLDLMNLSCNSNFPENSVCVWNVPQCSDPGLPAGDVVGTSGALYGRWEARRRIRTKRRLKEREALFLLTEYVSNIGAFTDPPPLEPWVIRRNVNFRYAVR